MNYLHQNNKVDYHLQLKIDYVKELSPDYLPSNLSH